MQNSPRFLLYSSELGTSGLATAVGTKTSENQSNNGIGGSVVGGGCHTGGDLVLVSAIMGSGSMLDSAFGYASAGVDLFGFCVNVSHFSGVDSQWLYLFLI